MYLHLADECGRVVDTRVVADLTGWPSGDNPGTFLPFLSIRLTSTHEPSYNFVTSARGLGSGNAHIALKRICRH
jgi:hypothetical protein